MAAVDLQFETGPCKLRRPSSASFLIIERDPERRNYFVYKGDAATELPTCDVGTSSDDPQRQWQQQSGDYPFTPFTLVPDGTGRAWQLLLVTIPPPGHSLDDLAQIQRDLVLGELPNEEGRVGLVPRFTDGAPTPGTQVTLQRAKTGRLQDVYIVNRRGTLHIDGMARYFFGRTRYEAAKTFCFHKIISLIDVGPTETLEFVRVPDHEAIVALPPIGVDAREFEQQHFHPLPLRQVHDPPMERDWENFGDANCSVLDQEQPVKPPMEPVVLPPQSSPLEALYVFLVAMIAFFGVMVGSLLFPEDRVITQALDE